MVMAAHYTHGCIAGRPPRAPGYRAGPGPGTGSAHVGNPASGARPQHIDILRLQRLPSAKESAYLQRTGGPTAPAARRTAIPQGEVRAVHPIAATPGGIRPPT